MRILVAEDEPLIRMFIAETLEEAGFDVVEAATGTQACQLIEHPGQVELVVTDLNLPGADGAAVAKRARAHTPEIPVLFVSARSDLLPAFSPPVPYSALPKPFTKAQLVTAISELVERQSRHADLDGTL